MAAGHHKGTVVPFYVCADGILLLSAVYNPRIDQHTAAIDNSIYVSQVRDDAARRDSAATCGIYTIYNRRLPAVPYSREHRFMAGHKAFVKGRELTRGKNLIHYSRLPSGSRIFYLLFPLFTANLFGKIPQITPTKCRKSPQQDSANLLNEIAQIC